MRLENRLSPDHTALVLLECLVAAMAALAAVPWLLGVAVARGAISWVVGRLGLPPLLADVGTQVVALLALLLLVAALRFVVVEYRRFLDRAPAIRGPVALTLGPLVGLAVPFAYAFSASGSPRLHWLLSGVVVLSAHALAFRILAAWSRDRELRRLGELAGVVAGAPAGLALVATVTDRVAVGPLGETGRLLLAVPGWGLVPRGWPVLATAPLVVSGAFGLYRYLWAGDRVDVPDPDVPRFAPALPATAAPAVDRLLPDDTLTDLAMASANRLHDYASERWGHADRSAADPPPVPTPPRASRKRTDGDASAGASGTPGPRPPRSASSSSSSSASPSTSSSAASSTSDGADGSARSASTTDSGESDPESSGLRRVKPAAVDPDEETDDERGDGDPGDDAREDESDADDGGDEDGSDDRNDGDGNVNDRNVDDDGKPDDDSQARETASPATDEEPSPAGDQASTDESSTANGGDDADAASGADGEASAGPDESTSRPAPPADDSHTRIYSADVGDADAASVVETCPECDADVPSDGTYEFCPLCGHEL